MEGSKNGDDGGAEGVIEAGQSLLNDQTFPIGCPTLHLFLN